MFNEIISKILTLLRNVVNYILNIRLLDIIRRYEKKEERKSCQKKEELGRR